MPSSFQVEIFFSEGHPMRISCSPEALAHLTHLHDEEVYRIRSVIISKVPTYPTFDSIKYQSTDPNAPNFVPPLDS
jgi:hypothetical protein